jgi:hypothetical protein
VKKYQKSAVDAPNALELTVPERVNVVMAEVAAAMREGLLALAVGTGLQVMSALMEPTSPRWLRRRASTTVRGSRCGTATRSGR